MKVYNDKQINKKSGRANRIHTWWEAAASDMCHVSYNIQGFLGFLELHVTSVHPPLDVTLGGKELQWWTRDQTLVSFLVSFPRYHHVRKQWKVGCGLETRLSCSWTSQPLKWNWKQAMWTRAESEWSLMLSTHHRLLVKGSTRPSSLLVLLWLEAKQASPQPPIIINNPGKLVSFKSTSSTQLTSCSGLHSEWAICASIFSASL